MMKFYKRDNLTLELTHIGIKFPDPYEMPRTQFREFLVVLNTIILRSEQTNSPKFSSMTNFSQNLS